MQDETDTVAFPTAETEPFLDDHRHTSDPREAHPIDPDIVHTVCGTKAGPVLLHYDLAAIQAVAVSDILPFSCETEHWITAHPRPSETVEVERPRDRPGRLHYYQVESVTFYDLCSIAHEMYDHRIEIEHIADIAEAHTRQYLSDVHGYDGNEFDSTLCSAYNDETPQSGTITRESVPENAHYAFTDSRGLVIEQGTHSFSEL